MQLELFGNKKLELPPKRRGIHVVFYPKGMTVKEIINLSDRYHKEYDKIRLAFCPEGLEWLV